MIKLEAEKRASLDKLLGVDNVDKIFGILTDIKMNPDESSHKKIDEIVAILEKSMPRIGKKYKDLTAATHHVADKLETLVYIIKNLTT